MDERALAERLITYDTSKPDELSAAAGFVKGWLGSQDLEVLDYDFDGLPVVQAATGPRDGPRIVLHGHLDVVPGREGQFDARVEGDRLIGRGAYDMKGALAAMMCALSDATAQDAIRVHLICVPDEESEDIDRRSTDAIIADGLRGDFAITGEPTDLHIGVQAKGVLALRVEVQGTAAHGSTPWLGDNAILKAYDIFRRIETLPFGRESSDLFDRPSINVSRIVGGDAFNKVPDVCTMAVDIRFLPNQDPGDRESGDHQVVHARSRDRVPPQSIRARVARRGRPIGAGGSAERRPRRSLRRHLVPRSGDPRGRVRARGWRASRSGGMGVDRLAGQVPARARRLHHRVARALSLIHI